MPPPRRGLMGSSREDLVILIARMEEMTKGNREAAIVCQLALSYVREVIDKGQRVYRMPVKHRIRARIRMRKRREKLKEKGDFEALRRTHRRRDKPEA